MRQAGVSVPADDVRIDEAWDEMREDGTPDGQMGVRRPITGGRARTVTGATATATADRPRIVTADRPRTADRARAATALRQPPAGPIAVNVADRYAKALELSPTPATVAPPRTPRRSQAAMRDRELRPTRRDAEREREREQRARAAAARDAGDARDAAVIRARSAQRSTPDPGPARPTPARTRPATQRPATQRPATQRPAAQRSVAPPPPAAAPPPAPAAAPPPAPVGGVPGRRTVTIRGRGAERDLTWSPYHSRRRPPTPAHERPGFKADRMALWAVFLGLVLVLVAATSSHAAVLLHAVH